MGCTLKRPTTSRTFTRASQPLRNKSKKKQIVIESSSEEEDKEREYDEDEMALCIKKFNKYISKRRPFKGDRKEKTRKKGVLQLWQEWTLYYPLST
jgi:hypothetical protein